MNMYFIILHQEILTLVKYLINSCCVLAPVALHTNIRKDQFRSSLI